MVPPNIDQITSDIKKISYVKMYVNMNICKKNQKGFKNVMFSSVLSKDESFTTTLGWST